MGKQLVNSLGVYTAAGKLECGKVRENDMRKLYIPNICTRGSSGDDRNFTHVLISILLNVQAL